MLIELRLFPLAQKFPFFLFSVFSNFCEKVGTCYIRDLSLSVNFLLKLAVVEVMAARETQTVIWSERNQVALD